MKKNGMPQHAAGGRTPGGGVAEIDARIIRILIADDHTVVTDGFKLLLERELGFKVVAVAKSGEEAVRLASGLLPDVILMDIHMRDITGLQAAHMILEQNPGMNIIILTMSDNDEFVRHSLEIGVKGYLLKESTAEEIVKAVKEVVVNDNPYYAPSIQKKILAIRNEPSRPTKQPGGELNARLTPRQMEVLHLLAQGKTSGEIAKMLLVSTKTVAKHRQEIMDKTGIHDAVSLTRYALLRGFSQL